VFHGLEKLILAAPTRAIAGDDPVTLDAGLRSVLSQERERAPAVVETRGGLPRGGGVTRFARRGKLAPVLVEVARRARGVEPEKRARRIDPLVLPRGELSDEFRLMAIVTTERGVLPLQPVAREGVIETPAAAVPIDELEVAPVMLYVTHLALPVLGPAVETTLISPRLLDRRVAREAPVSGELAVRSVAFRAVLHAFEKGVRTVEFPRRDLSRRRVRQNYDQDGSDQLNSHPNQP
jgi:hypothetical protein